MGSEPTSWVPNPRHNRVITGWGFASHFLTLAQVATSSRRTKPRYILQSLYSLLDKSVTMAAEASGSSSSADSYLGSLISLTSKSEIRYEGVLFTINTEEASIGLRNVRSFGTEGRRKDGPQIPPIDKVYEYIVFRGSDIKDLQVKSSPPPAVQTSSIHNDPAIIQSHYSQAATSANKPAVNDTAGSDHSTQMSPFQSNLPLYQPGGTMPTWGSSAPLTATASGPTPPPMQWQGYYGASSSNLQNQPFFQLPQGMPIPPPAQQPIRNPVLNAPLPTGLSVSQPSDFQPMLLRPLGSVGFDGQTTMLPGQPSLEKDVVNSMPSQAKFVSGPMTSYNGMTESLSADAGSSVPPSLVTPGQFLQSETAPASRSQPLQTTQKDAEVVQFSSAESMSPSSVSVPISTESQPEAPLLPLPSHSNPQYNRGPSYGRYMHRGGHGRGRRSELSNSATSYTEDFDFEAMNEKFKKDEVWGHLGKSKANDDPNEDSLYGDNVEVQFPQVEIKPVYKKDDFFDTLSSNSFDNGSRNGRNRFSEQTRFDNEQQGNFSRYRGGQGGRGSGYGGYQRGGYYGRGGYGGYNAGRSQGHHNVYRP